MLPFITMPLQKTAKVHEKEYRASENDRPAADDQPECYPAHAGHHKDQEPKLFLVAKEENCGQSAEGRKPIDSVILQHRSLFFLPQSTRRKTNSSRCALWLACKPLF